MTFTRFMKITYLPLILGMSMVFGLPAGAAVSGKERLSFYEKKESWIKTMLAARERFQEMEDALGEYKPALTDVIVGDESAQRISVNVSELNHLWLVVTPGNDGHVQDHAIWAQARLIAKDGTVTRLDTLEPVSRKVGQGALGKNEDWQKRPLQVGGVKFDYGLYAHAPSVLRYNIGKKYEKFEAQAGICDYAEGKGSVRFVVHGNYDKILGLWRKIAQDFPIESNRLARDTGHEHMLWFIEGAQNIRVNREKILPLLEKIGPQSTDLWSRYRALCKQEIAAGDSRWLNIYLEASSRSELFRTARRRMNLFNIRALKMAVEDLSRHYPEKYDPGKEYIQKLITIEQQLPQIKASLTKGDVKSLSQINEILKFKAKVLLSNPLLDFERLLLVKRSQNSPALGLPANWQGNCSLPKKNYDNEIAVLTPVTQQGKIRTLYRPPGSEYVGDVDLHFDADKMIFTMPGGDHGRWQIFEIKSDGTGLRQVSPGIHNDVDNYDACYLPDERIIFASTRCFQGIPCVGGSDAVANLCVMDAQGGSIRQLCFDQDHNWYPTVLNNGRVLYTRWEYSDTPHYFSRLLFHMNPDGTGQMEYYGSNSHWPNSMFYTRPIPGDPTKVVTIVSGHHGVRRMGQLVILDPSLGRHEAKGVVQAIPGYGKKVEPVIRDKLVDALWPRFLHPYPLSDKYFLVSCKPNLHAPWGIYLVDIFDNMVLIKEQAGYVLFEPIPLRKIPRPAVIPDKIRPESKDALVYLLDIYKGDGLKDIPRGTVKKLRIYEFHYSYNRMGGHMNVAVEGGWDVHRILGTVPVQDDGSAVFKVPANTPLAVQPLDAEGKALQVMRSWFTAMPGEVLSCVGCHEKQNSTPPLRPSQASGKKPSEITPWYGPVRGFSFRREVQPVLDKYCVGCHNGNNRIDKKEIPNFTAKEKNEWGAFSSSYLALHPYVRRPGPESDYHMCVPMEYHADTSELIQMLQKGHHGVKLDAESWDRLITWIDLNVPAIGTWSESTKGYADNADWYHDITKRQALPNRYRQRRLEMRKLYANLDEDPELIPVMYKKTLPFVAPEAVSGKNTPIETTAGWPFNAEQAKKLQAQSRSSLRRTVELGGKIKMEMVLIPAGEYIMGDRQGKRDEQPLSKVKISYPFWMGMTEVTESQYQQFDPHHKNGYFNQNHKDHTTRGYSAEGKKKPVIRVSWEQAIAFCRWLSEKNGESFTLPTEAQWEWACRAGTATPFSYGNADSDFSQFANVADRSTMALAVSGVNPRPIANPNRYQAFLPKDTRFNDRCVLMSEVGKYQPNAWGLYDMHGNVWEWTRSNYKPYPYSENDGRNDMAAKGAKVVRGGSWRDRPQRARSGFRLSYRPYQKVFNVGFRVICPVDGKMLVKSNQ